MIPLKYKPDKKKETEYLKYVTDGRNPSFLADIDEKCEKYLGLSFEQVILLAPEELMAARASYQAKSATDRKEIKRAFNSIRKADNQYIQKVLYKNMPSEARKIAFDNAGVRTCPYCNRSFIQMVSSEKPGEYRSFFELDHFLSKSSYPMFAVSLYNLIPSCPFCNSVKLTQEFGYYPYDKKNRSDDIRFYYRIKGENFLTDEEQIEIKIERRRKKIISKKSINPKGIREKIMNKKIVRRKIISKKIVSDTERLYLEELYKSHRDIVQEIAGKVRIFGDGYLDSMCGQFPELFPDKGQAYRMLYGNYYEAVDFPKRPLAKFTRDIYEDSLGKGIEGWEE